MCWGEVWECPESGWSRQARWADFGGAGGWARRVVARRVRGAGRPARANKEKSSVCGTVGREVSCCVRGSGKPASRFWQRERRGKLRDFSRGGQSR